jgi:hypothetical protein
VDYGLGLARNQTLRGLIEDPFQQAREGFTKTGEATRVFREFSCRTVSKTWSRWRRVVAKAEYISGKENPRFIVTSLAPEVWEGRLLYERLYCARGEMENRIKDQMSLFAHRLSTESFCGNRLRLFWLSVKRRIENWRKREIPPCGRGFSRHKGSIDPIGVVAGWRFLRTTPLVHRLDGPVRLSLG